MSTCAVHLVVLVVAPGARAAPREGGPGPAAEVGRVRAEVVVAPGDGASLVATHGRASVEVAT